MVRSIRMSTARVRIRAIRTISTTTAIHVVRRRSTCSGGSAERDSCLPCTHGSARGTDQPERCRKCSSTAERPGDAAGRRNPVFHRAGQCQCAVLRCHAALTFLVQTGSASASQSLAITNAGIGVLEWQVSAQNAWLTVDRSRGSTPDTILVTANIAGRLAGTYEGSLRCVPQAYPIWLCRYDW